MKNTHTVCTGLLLVAWLAFALVSIFFLDENRHYYAYWIHGAIWCITLVWLFFYGWWCVDTDERAPKFREWIAIAAMMMFALAVVMVQRMTNRNSVSNLLEKISDDPNKIEHASSSLSNLAFAEVWIYGLTICSQTLICGIVIWGIVTLVRERF